MHSTHVNGERKAPSKRDILRIAKEREVRYVRLSFVDILGIGKNVTIPVGELESALEGKVTFDGGSIDGFVRGEEADMMLLPDLATFAVYPWTAGSENVEARLICDIATPDGEPFEGCPRTTLRRALEDAGAANDVRRRRRPARISGGGLGAGAARMEWRDARARMVRGRRVDRR